MWRFRDNRSFTLLVLSHLVVVVAFAFINGFIMCNLLCFRCSCGSHLSGGRVCRPQGENVKLVNVVPPCAFAGINSRNAFVGLILLIAG